MQDRFVGDIGDFGKYGLLRALTGIYPEAEPKLSLGVVWYVPEGEVGSPQAGTHTDYLFGGRLRASLRECDPRLFAGLKNLLCDDSRNLGALEQSGLLGEAVYYSGKFSKSTDSRRLAIEAARKAMESSAVVFLDPDNGLATDRMETHRQRSVEHVHLEELKAFTAPGRTIVLYQCFLRGQTRPDQMQQQMGRWYRNLKTKLSLDSGREPRILAFRPGNPRGFVVLPSAEHAETCDRRLSNLVSLNSPWHGHFYRHEDLAN